MRRPGQEAKNPIMRKYNQNKIKSSASERIEDYILEQAMLTSGGAPTTGSTTKMLQGFMLPPPPPPGGAHNGQHHLHHQQDHLLSNNDHAAMTLTASGPGYTIQHAKHNNVHAAVHSPDSDSDDGGNDVLSSDTPCQLHGDASGTRNNECPEIHRALDGVRYIAECTMREEESVKVKEDWKYVAMVLDRLFLWIFTVAVLVGSAGIILQAPALYDTREAIDLELSEIEAATAKPLSYQQKISTI